MPRRYSLGKRAETVDRTRRRIESALLRLLGSQSYAAITMFGIAAEADVSVRTVQRHYGSKDDLLATCARLPAQALSQELSKRPPAAVPHQGIQSLIEALFAVYDRHSAEAWAVYSRATDVPELAKIIQVGIEARMSHIERLIERWPDAWAMDKESVTLTLRAMTSYLTWRAFTQTGRIASSEAAARVTELLTRGLLEPQRPPTDDPPAG